MPLKNVLLQIEALNDAFRGRTVDTSPQAVKDHFTSAFAAKNVATDAKIEFFLSGSVNYVNNKRWYNCGESDTIYDAIRMVRPAAPAFSTFFPPKTSLPSLPLHALIC